MNRFFRDNVKTAYPVNTEEYQLIVESIHRFRTEFDALDVYRDVNKKLPKGVNLDRDKLMDTIRVMVRLKLVSYYPAKIEGSIQTLKLKLTKG